MVFLGQMLTSSNANGGGAGTGGAVSSFAEHARIVKDTCVWYIIIMITIITKRETKHLKENYRPKLFIKPLFTVILAEILIDLVNALSSIVVGKFTIAQSCCIVLNR